MAVGPRVLEAAGLRESGRLSRFREWWEQEHIFGYGLIVPAVVLLTSLVAFPFGMAIWFSLSDYWVGSPGGFVGLANYRAILGNETFRQTLQNSFVFTGIALSFKIVLGVWLAMLLARNLSFKRVIRGIVLLPFVIPTALATLAYQVGLQGGNLGQGGAISLFIFPALAMVVFFQLRYVRQE